MVYFLYCNLHVSLCFDFRQLKQIGFTLFHSNPSAMLSFWSPSYFICRAETLVAPTFFFRTLPKTILEASSDRSWDPNSGGNSVFAALIKTSICKNWSLNFVQSHHLALKAFEIELQRRNYAVLSSLKYLVNDSNLHFSLRAFFSFRLMLPIVIGIILLTSFLELDRTECRLTLTLTLGFYHSIVTSCLFYGPCRFLQYRTNQRAIILAFCCWNMRSKQNYEKTKFSFCFV